METAAMGQETQVEGVRVERQPQDRLVSVPMTTGAPKGTVPLANRREDLYGVRLQNSQTLFP